MVKPTKLHIKAGERIMILKEVKHGNITLKQASEILKNLLSPC